MVAVWLKNITDQDARIYVALATAFGIYADTILAEDPSMLQRLTARVLNNGSSVPSGNTMIDAFASWLQKAHDYLPPLIANMFLEGTLMSITEEVLECQTRNMKVRVFRTWSMYLLTPKCADRGRRGRVYGLQSFSYIRMACCGAAGVLGEGAARVHSRSDVCGGDYRRFEVSE